MERQSLYGVLADVEQWNSDLENFQYSLFHLREWVESVSTPTLHPIYIDLYDGEIKIGKIAGLKIVRNKWLNIKQLFFYASPSLIEATELIAEKCLKALVTFAKENRYINLRCAPLDSKMHTTYNTCNLRKITYNEYIIRFDNSFNDFKPGQGLKKKLHLAARVDTQFCSSANPVKDLDLMLQLMNITKNKRTENSRSNYNPFSLRFVTAESLLKLIETGKGKIYHSLNAEEIHYVTLSLENGKQAYGLYNGTNEFGYKNGIPGFMAFMLSQYYNKNGFEYFNLGASLDNKEDDFHLSNFKKQVGCVPYPVFTIKSDYLIYPYKALIAARKLKRLFK